MAIRIMIIIIPIGLIITLVRMCISSCKKCAAERRERQLRQQAEEYARQQAGAVPSAPPAGQSAYIAPPPKYTPRDAPSNEKTPLMAENA